MPRVLGIDFETTFINENGISACRILEFGAVLWDVERKRAIESRAGLVKPDVYAHDPRSESLCGITEDMILNASYSTLGALEEIAILADQADYFVAHNGLGFDKIVMEEESKRVNYFSMKQLPWIDTQCDLPFPKEIETRKLSYLSTEYGFLNPFPHQAISDVSAMLTLFSKFEFETVKKYAHAKTFILKSIMPPPWKGGPSNGNELHKAHGFKFQGDVKEWHKKVKDFDLESEKSVIPFKFTVHEVK